MGAEEEKILLRRARLGGMGLPGMIEGTRALPGVVVLMLCLGG